MRVIFEADVYPRLTIENGRFAARTPRRARFFATNHSIKKHETFPRKHFVASTHLHKAIADQSFVS